MRALSACSTVNDLETGLPLLCCITIIRSTKMASGYGLNGGRLSTWPQLISLGSVADDEDPVSGPGRCFPFWQELLACYVVNTNAEDDSGKSKCAPMLEDYYECLHHKKEVRGFEERGMARDSARRMPGSLIICRV
jgi:hypothetical protein